MAEVSPVEKRLAFAEARIRQLTELVHMLVDRVAPAPKSKTEKPAAVSAASADAELRKIQRNMHWLREAEDSMLIAPRKIGKAIWVRE